MARIVVIGAGVGGLASAARLAAQGHRVTVFEQAPTVGGKLASLVRTTSAGDFRFDLGPSLLTLPQVFVDLWRDTGAAIEDELDLVALDPIVRHIFPDGSVLDSCADPVEFATRIEALMGAPAARDWSRLWRRAARVWDLSWTNILTSSVDRQTIVRLARSLPDLATIAPGRSLHGLGRRLGDPRLRAMIDRYASYVGSDPHRAPAALVAIPYAELAFGGWYVRGGLARLADVLLARATGVGAVVCTATRVTRIETDAGGVVGVRLADGTACAADVVVANADAAAVYGELLERPRQAARLARRSLSGFLVLLGLSGRTVGLSHHTVAFPHRYGDEYRAIFAANPRPANDPAIFISAPADAAPPGHEAWSVLVNAPVHGAGGRGVDWRRPGLADAYADRILALLAARGLDVRDRILVREIRTPADLEVATASLGGAIYGTPRHGVAGLLRPRNRTPVRGLYLVGGSTHPGGGLPMVTLSAEIVAREIGPASRGSTSGGSASGGSRR